MLNLPGYRHSRMHPLSFSIYIYIFEDKSLYAFDVYHRLRLLYKFLRRAKKRSKRENTFEFKLLFNIYIYFS